MSDGNGKDQPKDKPVPSGREDENGEKPPGQAGDDPEKK